MIKWKSTSWKDRLNTKLKKTEKKQQIIEFKAKKQPKLNSKLLEFLGWNQFSHESDIIYYSKKYV